MQCGRPHHYDAFASNEFCGPLALLPFASSTEKKGKIIYLQNLVIGHIFQKIALNYYLSC